VGGIARASVERLALEIAFAVENYND